MIPSWKRATLRDVLLFTAPPLALVLYVFVSACLDYHRIRQYDDWWARTGSVERYVSLRAESALSVLTATELRERIANDYDRAEALSLQVDTGAWDRIRSDVGGTWGEWIDASIVRGNEYHPVELRLRGDNSVHWTGEKKSLSIKTPRDRLYKGRRRLIFSLKTVLPQHMVSVMAQEFDLLAPESAVVPIFVNGHYYGIFRFIEPVDESFLRRIGRMPGNVFRGDAATRGERYKNLPRSVFLNPYAWDRVANNDRPGAPQGALPDFLSSMNEGSVAGQRAFLRRFDEDELARLFALMLFVGDPYHMSDVHNQLWYEDPAAGTLHPIVWDLRLLRLDEPRERFSINRFWRTALRDPRLFDAAMGHVAAWLKDRRFDRAATECVESVHARFADHFAYDLLRAGTVYASPEPRRIVDNFVRDNVETLTYWASDARVSFLARELEPGTWLIDLRADGRTGADLLALELDARVAPREARLTADRDLDGVPGEGDRTAAAALSEEGGRAVLRLQDPEPLLPGCGGTDGELVPEPLLYRFFLSTDAPLDGLRPALARRSDGAPVEALALEPDAAVAPHASFHPWALAEPPVEDVRLAGELRLYADLEVPAGATLTIEPGTTLSLNPDVSVLVRGRLDARGTPDRPIRVQPAEEGAPWGVFALQGAGASGSRLEHVRFSGGGGATVGGVEYKGAVCVHGARDVVFADCELRDNRRCDDLLNVVRGDVDLLRCRFLGANADAIDYDLSTGTIAHCDIEGSPNDGLDLMTASPRILSTRISGSDDKGISFGEDCAPLVYDCDITDCARGLEVKDFSAPVLIASRVTGNELGLLARSKNWRYGGGGHAKLIDTVLADNAADRELLDGSRVTVPAGEASWARELFAVDGTAPRALVERAFREDFGDPRDGWRRSGSCRSVLVRERDLRATFDRGAGAIGEAVDWDLADGEHLLVVEVAGAGLTEVEVEVAGAEATLRAPVRLNEDPDVFHYVAVPLPPGRYRGLALRARAAGLSGELRLHGYRVFDRPRRSP